MDGPLSSRGSVGIGAPFAPKRWVRGYVELVDEDCWRNGGGGGGACAPRGPDGGPLEDGPDGGSYSRLVKDVE